MLARQAGRFDAKLLTAEVTYSAWWAGILRSKRARSPIRWLQDGWNDGAMNGKSTVMGGSTSAPSALIEMILAVGVSAIVLICVNAALFTALHLHADASDMDG